MSSVAQDTQTQEILVQRVVHQRGQAPAGVRVLTDGRVQRSTENPLPTPTERLDLDKALNWADVLTLSAEQLEAARAAIRLANFFSLEPRLLINYCKEDPGTAIWTVSLDGQTARVVVFDPRPRRNAALDALAAAISEITGQTVA